MKKIMKTILFYYDRNKGLSFGDFLRKFLRFLLRNSKTKYMKTIDRFVVTYATKVAREKYVKIIPALRINRVLQYSPLNLSAIELYLDHYFDLLGSGWIKIYKGMDTIGINKVKFGLQRQNSRFNNANQKEVNYILSLLPQTYDPIDWHIDFKSGYRWKEDTYYKEIAYGQNSGIDIKVPWELARMQHIPQLALAYGQNQNNSDLSKKLVDEFRNQILDFIGSNPPRFGVNWRCTMDVGIRVANMLLGYNILKSFNANFDYEFELIFARSIYEHGKHCITNLEYSPELRSNHYLSDITGLLFASVYLPRNEETDCWLAFAVQEIISEMEHEFNEDGSNFEASTAYHRLSTELMLWSSILIINLAENKRIALREYSPSKLKVTPQLKEPSEQKFDHTSQTILPIWFWNRLEKALEFTSDISKPNGTIHQIGDNDSGRLFKIEPKFRKLNINTVMNLYENLEDYHSDLTFYLDEDILNHSHLLAVGSVIFNRQEWNKYESICPVESSLVRSFNLHGLPKLQPFDQYSSYKYRFESTDKKEEWGSDNRFVLLEESNLTDGVNSFAYPNFGIYGWKSENLYLAIRCGSIGQNGNGGHAHNDQLSMELFWKGQEILRDPGTYLYTPFPDIRYLYRSVQSHCVPSPLLKSEPNDISNIFGMFQKSTSTVVEFNKSSACFKYTESNSELILKIELTDSQITVNYPINSSKKFSPGYGKLLKG